jgi:hypothetical protein
MQWTNAHRERLYQIIEERWIKLEIDPFEEWLASLGIKWAELEYEGDAPEGTIAVHEGPGFENHDFRMCWVIPDDVALKMLALGIP